MKNQPYKQSQPSSSECFPQEVMEGRRDKLNEACTEQNQVQLCSKLMQTNANNEPGSGNLEGYSILAMARELIAKCLCAGSICAVCLSHLDYFCLQRGSSRPDGARVVQVNSPPADSADDSSKEQTPDNSFFFSTALGTLSEVTF